MTSNMSNDDSFNDSDEIFSLYSSKKVTDTFKAQLKKIAATNHHLNNAFSHVNNTESFCSEEKNTNSELPKIVQKQKVGSVGKKAVEKQVEPVAIIEDEPPIVSTEYSGKYLEEDSIEIVTEFLPRRSTRQSERLRKRRGRSYDCSLEEEAVEFISEFGPRKSTRQNERLRTRRIQPRSWDSWDTPIIPATKTTQGRSNGQKHQKRQKKKLIDEITLEDSPQQTENDDELNPELSVKVIWKSVNVKKFQIRKFQKLSYIFEQLSKEENIPEDKIILTFNNVRVNQNDTPDSLNLQVYHFLDGGVLTELTNSCQSQSSESSNCDTDSVVVKFQDANKKIIKINLNKNEKLKVGMIKCSEQLEVSLSKIKFFFDGELIEPCETPSSLGLENEEVIDIKISS